MRCRARRRSPGRWHGVPGAGDREGSAWRRGAPRRSSPRATPAPGPARQGRCSRPDRPQRATVSAPAIVSSRTGRATGAAAPQPRQTGRPPHHALGPEQPDHPFAMPGGAPVQRGEAVVNGVADLDQPGGRDERQEHGRARQAAKVGKQPQDARGGLVLPAAACRSRGGRPPQRRSTRGRWPGRRPPATARSRSPPG